MLKVSIGCHSRKGGNPDLSLRKQGTIQRIWIPVFTGMTDDYFTYWVIFLIHVTFCFQCLALFLYKNRSIWILIIL